MCKQSKDECSYKTVFCVATKKTKLCYHYGDLKVYFYNYLRHYCNLKNRGEGLDYILKIKSAKELCFKTSILSCIFHGEKKRKRPLLVYPLDVSFLKLLFMWG